jgi:pSer/pThr/pTyr-binding forkhead associated (FHA) protein
VPAIVLTLLQGLLLLLLYVFIGRAVRAVLRDLHTAGPTMPARPQRRATAQPRPAAQGGRGRKPDRKRVAPGQLVVHIPDGRPRVLDLDGAPITFGRSGAATVTLNDPYVSDQHARVEHRGGDWVITDLQSTNGTFVNQVKITSPTPITAGDQLGIGRTVVEVRK